MRATLLWETVVRGIRAMLDWTQVHEAFVMAIMTLLFVIFALIFIGQNRKVIRESRRQFSVLTKGMIFPSVQKVVDGTEDLLCLKIENPTNAPAEEVKIRIDPAWLERYGTATAEELGIAERHQKNLRAVNSVRYFTIMPKQAVYYAICALDDMERVAPLATLPLIVTVRYADAKKDEEFRFDLKAMATQLAVTSDYVRMERHHLSRLAELNETLQGLGNGIPASGRAY